jgi:hypothetical protein
LRVFNSFLYGWPILLVNWLVTRLFGNLWFYLLCFISSIFVSFLWALALVTTARARPQGGIRNAQGAEPKVGA